MTQQTTAPTAEDLSGQLQRLIMAAGRLESLGQVPGLDYRIDSDSCPSPEAMAWLTDSSASDLAPSLKLRSLGDGTVKLKINPPMESDPIIQTGRVVGLRGPDLALQAQTRFVLSSESDLLECAGALRLNMLATAAYTATREDTCPRHVSDALDVMAHLAGIETDQVRLVMELDRAGHRWTAHLPGGDLG